MRAALILSIFASLGCTQTLDEAKGAFDRGQYAEAARLFEKAQAAEPRCDTFFFLGLTRYRLREVDAALIAFQSAVQCDPKLVGAHLALAEAYGVRGNEAQTLVSLERVLALEPNNAAALRHAASLYLKNEVNDKAVPLLARLVQVLPSDVQARVDLGVAYAATGNREAAEKEYREALRLQPASASALTGLGNLSLKAGEEDSGIGLLQQAVLSAPGASEPRFLLGSAYNRLGRFEDAVKELETALQLGGERAEVQYHLARAYGGLGRQEDRKKALSRFSALTRETKQDVEAQRKALRLIESSRKLVATGDLRGAVEQLEEARPLRPGDDGVLYRLASLYYDLQRYEVARNYVQEAISVAPSQWVYQFLLGTIDKAESRWEMARESFEMAVKLNPSAAEAHNALGTVALQMNDRPGAIASFQRAAELDPKEPAYRLNLDAAQR